MNTSSFWWIATSSTWWMKSSSSWWMTTSPWWMTTSYSWATKTVSFSKITCASFWDTLMLKDCIPSFTVPESFALPSLNGISLSPPYARGMATGLVRSPPSIPSIYKVINHLEKGVYFDHLLHYFFQKRTWVLRRVHENPVSSAIFTWSEVKYLAPSILI